ncbi:ATPase domain-containing protein [Salinibaculum rarum]|uniref:ATPase domain-containing protein n=1 Tax=Salinibaculum rarum TaxID=3058903 RepID=UPI00265D703A|nr:ATPase domain-containing protein [Salinibaculum sp. KK48]
MRSTPWQRRLYSLGLAHHDQLNRAFGGGLPKGSIVLVEGTYGAGKSTLAGRFAYGLTEQSHEVTYLSTERPVGPFLDQMRSLSYDVTSALLDRQLLYLFGDLSGFDSDGDPPQLLSRLTSSRGMWETDVAILDTFGDILRYDPTFDVLAGQTDRRRAAQRVISFFRRIARGDRTVVLTVDPSGLADATLEPFRAIADVLLQVTATSGGRSVRRSIDVKRFVGMGQQVDDSIGFSIRPGIGIVVENRRVV